VQCEPPFAAGRPAARRRANRYAAGISGASISVDNSGAGGPFAIRVSLAPNPRRVRLANRATARPMENNCLGHPAFL